MLVSGIVLTAVLALPPARLNHLRSELETRGIPPAEIELLLADPRLVPYPPPVKRKSNWAEFRKKLLSPESVADGRDFLRTHADILARAEQEFGVHREDLAAIVRIETDFGRFTGEHEVLRVFYTQMLRAKTAQRWRWASQNFAALAAHCRSSGLDCYEVRGSYAGAVGLVQFLPYSILHYGKDGNGDGKVDLFLMEDAVMSAAHFLVRHGWKPDAGRRKRALGRYYGSPRSYPDAALAYAEKLRTSFTSAR